MADNYNDLNAQVNQLVDQLNYLTSETGSTIFDIVDVKKKLEQVLKDFPLSEIRELKDRLKDNNQEVIDAIAEAENNNTQRIKAEQSYQEKLRKLNKELDAINNNITDANEADEKFLEEKKTAKQKEIDDLKAQHQAYIDDREEDYQLEQELNARHLAQQEEANKKQQEAVDKVISGIGNFAVKLNAAFVDLLQSSVAKINNVYIEHAGTMSAALDLSVTDIQKLQRNIASSLRDQSLNSVLSGTRIFEESSKLVGSGYTNESKLQASAEGISIARELAPNLNVDTSQVKNLTNIFGSDFITRFAAIQAAVQDTAGSTLGLNESLTKLMSDLEPVYTNAELNSQAMQDTSDIEATLADLREQGLITGSISDEQLNAIQQLLDPAKAISSNNVMVKAAASQYGLDNIWGASNPVMAAWQALQGVTQSAYENVGMSNSSYDRLSRGLVAGVYGNTSTMNASWMGQNYLQGIDTLKTENLNTTYNEQLSKLSGGQFTTQAEKESNFMENSNVAQGLSTADAYIPKIYTVLSESIFGLLKNLPIKIAAALKISDIATSGLSKLFGGLGSAATTAGAGSASLLSRLGGSITGAFTGAGTLGGLSTSAIGSAAMGTLGVGAGVIGGYNLYQNWDSDKSLKQNLGFNGNYLDSTVNYAGMGAGVGAIVGSIIPGIGTAIGTGVGTLVGAVAGLTTATLASNEKKKENTEALEAQTQSTKDLLGQGVTAMSSLEAQSQLAKGGGIVHLQSGDYALDYSKSNYDGFARGLDYVPYDDYVVRAHKGEAIISAKAAEKLRKKDPNFFNDASDDGVSIVNALREQTESIVDAVNGEKKYSPLTQKGPRTYTIKNVYV